MSTIIEFSNKQSSWVDAVLNRAGQIIFAVCFNVAIYRNCFQFETFLETTPEKDVILSVTIHIKCSIACCLINIVYLTACAFIRTWWRCTCWMMSPMTLNWHKKSTITSYSLVWRLNQLGKVINRIPGLHLLSSSLPGSASRTHVESLIIKCIQSIKYSAFVEFWKLCT